MSKTYIAILGDTHHHEYKTRFIYKSARGFFIGRESHCIVCGYIRYEGVAEKRNEDKIADDLKRYELDIDTKRHVILNAIEVQEHSIKIANARKANLETMLRNINVGHYDEAVRAYELIFGKEELE